MALRFSALRLSKLFLVSFAALLLPNVVQSQTTDVWHVSCQKTECAATAGSLLKTGFQLLVYRIEGRPVLEIITPLGINLQKGIGLSVDEGAVALAKMLTCDVEGCRAFKELTSPILGSLKRGANLEVIVQAFKSREVLSFKYSLIGFTKAYDALSNGDKK